MPVNNQLDSLELESLALPFDTLTKPLDDNPRILAGKDFYASVSGKLLKRAGCVQIQNGDIGTDRVERLLVYEVTYNSSQSTSATNTPVSKVYIVGSFRDANTGHYYLAYLDLNWSTLPFPGSWIRFPDKRGCNYSQFPHQMVLSRDLVYIKSFPDTTAVGSDRDTTDNGWLGSIIFDGLISDPPTVRAWGVDAPTIVCSVLNMAGAPASGGTVTVLLGWRYAYAWKSKYGHYSCHSPLVSANATWPLTADFSFTGPFTNRTPQISIQGHADTTEYPYIEIYRTFDGGGTFYFLDEIANTATPSNQFITYTDNKFTGGNPIPDALLDTSRTAPSLTLNAPPPFNLNYNAVPFVPYSMFPQQSSPLATYAGRIWYALGNIVFFSANEELDWGVPQEAFPTGLTGNFYQFENQVVALAATYQALYIFTTREVYWLQGSSLASFQLQLLFGDVGMANHPEALCVYDTNIYWMSSDYRVMMAVGPQRQVLADSISPTIRQHLKDASVRIMFTRYAAMEKNWLLMTFFHSSTANWGQSVTYVFNFHPKLLSWNTPWSFNVTALAVGKAVANDLMPHLIMGKTSAPVTSGLPGFGGSTTPPKSALVYLDVDDQRFNDWDPASNAYVDYDCHAALSPGRNPLGNHVNPLRLPGMTSVLYAIKIDRTQFTNDVDPTVTYWLDDITLNPATGTVVAGLDPPRRVQSKGYRTLWYFVNLVCERVLVQINVPAQPTPFELQSLALTWNPDGGA